MSEQLSLRGFRPQSPKGYPNEPGFRRYGTSQQAAAAIKPRRVILEEKVYAAIKAAGRAGLTADECAAVVGVDFMSVRPRCTELSKPNDDRPAMIEDSRQRRPSRSGHPATVWIAI